MTRAAGYQRYFSAQIKEGVRLHSKRSLAWMRVPKRLSFAAKTGARTYAAWADMLASERLELVSIATYASHHVEMTIASAGQGVRAIYCEKPIATRLTDTEQMIITWKRAGTLLVINHNRRF